MNLGRSVALVAAATAILTSGVAAQSPSLSPSASPAPSQPAIPGASAVPSLSATPFPWPTFPRERLARGTFSEWPSGPPTASTTDRGIRLDLWLSSTTAAPGDWVQAIVRATNVGHDTAWVKTGEACDPGTQTRIDIDLSPVVRMGVEQAGAAADFKADLLRAADITHDHFRSPRAVLERERGMIGIPLAECTQGTGHFVEAIPPGGLHIERFYWRAAQSVPYGPRGVLQPLEPGTIPITVHWELGGRGPRPSQERLAGWQRPITLTTDLKLTGDGPGTPSYPELIDAALADPTWRAWVEQNGTGGEITVESAALRGPPYAPAEADVVRREVLDGTAPNGALELLLGETRYSGAITRIWVTLAAVYVDPWTGGVLATWFRDWHA